METRARYVLIGLFTLAVIAGGFSFVFWLNHSGGLGQRVSYRVRFETSVSGLGIGSDVLFNGIRVGEVTGLDLNPETPAEVTVRIAVAADTPIREDTHVGLAYGGLTGTASIALEGGTPAAPAPKAVDGEPPLLVADAGATQDWTTAAREAFARVDTILSDNADALHEMIGNINTFAGALARNSDRIDKIAAGLERMTGSAAAAPATIYDLTAPEDFEPGLTVPAHQLVVTLPTSLVSLDTQRFLVRSGDSETLAFDAAKWSDSIPALIRAKVIQGFENAGYLHTGGDTQGLAADRQLLIDIRSFEILSGTAPVAEIEFSAKILSADGQVIDGRIFRASAPVSAMQAEAAAAALDQAFGTAVRELIPWAMRIP